VITQPPDADPIGTSVSDFETVRPLGDSTVIWQQKQRTSPAAAPVSNYVLAWIAGVSRSLLSHRTEDKQAVGLQKETAMRGRRPRLVRVLAGISF